MNILVFDIETIPDTQSGARIYGLKNLSEGDIARVMFSKQLQKTESTDFLPLHLHKVVAISVVLRTKDKIKVFSLGQEDATEAEIITRFFRGIDKFSFTLVSWNGSGFDLPVLHYRGLLNKVVAKRYWDQGDDDREMKFNNYLNRYHWRHIDLMDVLAGFSSRAVAPLDQIAVMLDFPGKLGMSGEKVWQSYQQGEIRVIRQYCETDALNTYLVYLRWQLMRGHLLDNHYEEECTLLKNFLVASSEPHLNEFLSVWSEH